MYKKNCVFVLVSIPALFFLLILHCLQSLRCMLQKNSVSPFLNFWEIHHDRIIEREREREREKVNTYI